MSRLLFLCALLFTAIQSVHADEIDDRIRRRKDADEARQEQESAARRYQGNLQRYQVYQNFAAVHGGVADAGTCTVGTPECSPSYFDRTRTTCIYFGRGSTSFTGFDPASNHVLRRCRLTLNDGLACEVAPNSKDNAFGTEKWFKADCYDRAGNYSQLFFGANGGKIAPKKYPPRIRVGKGKCAYECDGRDGKRYLYHTSYCPAWSFGEDLPNGVHLDCRL